MIAAGDEDEFSPNTQVNVRNSAGRLPQRQQVLGAILQPEKLGLEDIK